MRQWTDPDWNPDTDIVWDNCGMHPWMDKGAQYADIRNVLKELHEELGIPKEMLNAGIPNNMMDKLNIITKVITIQKEMMKNWNQLDDILSTCARTVIAHASLSDLVDIGQTCLREMLTELDTCMGALIAVTHHGDVAAKKTAQAAIDRLATIGTKYATGFPKDSFLRYALPTTYSVTLSYVKAVDNINKRFIESMNEAELPIDAPPELHTTALDEHTRNSNNVWERIKDNMETWINKPKPEPRTKRIAAREQERFTHWLLEGKDPQDAMRHAINDVSEEVKKQPYANTKRKDKPPFPPDQSVDQPEWM